MRKMIAGDACQGSVKKRVMSSTEISAVWGIQVEDAHLNKTRMIMKNTGKKTAVSSQDMNSTIDPVVTGKTESFRGGARTKLSSRSWPVCGAFIPNRGALRQ